MQLNDEQKKQVEAWLEEGAKLSDVQQRLADELGVRLTYMEARFLLDDLKLSVQEKKAPESTPAPLAEELSAGLQVAPDQSEGGLSEISGDAVLQNDSGPTSDGSGVSVQVDTLARPGTMVSGSVVFSDGNRAEWYLDSMGRLGMKAETPGYRPPQADVLEFQQALDRELSKIGF